MKNLKNQKGITLVALVVTIIVLLILAGVSLSLVAGSNGIMTRTVAARDKHNAATAKERAELAIAEVQMEWYEKYYVNTGSDATTQTLKEYLNAKKTLSGSGYIVTIDSATNKVNVKADTEGAEVLAEGTLTYSNNDRNLQITNWTYLETTT